MKKAYILGQNTNIENIASFLYDSKDFYYDDVKSLLLAARSLQDNFVNACKIVESDSSTFHHQVIKSYLKFRHNVFANLFLKLLKVETNLETDVDLSLYGFDKTPDYIFKHEGINYILEFTVARQRDRVEFLKGGSTTEGKYFKIAKELQKMTKEPYECLTIPFILTAVNHMELKLLVQELGATYDQSIMSDFAEIFNKNYDILSPHIYDSFVKKYVPNKKMKKISDQIWDPLKLMDGMNPRDFLEVTVTRRLLTKIMFGFENYKNWSLKFRRKKGVEIAINITNEQVRIEEGTLSFEVFDSVIDNRDLRKLIEVAVFYENGKKIQKSKSGGDCSFLVSKEPTKKEVFPPEEIFSVHEIYCNNEPFFIIENDEEKIKENMQCLEDETAGVLLKKDYWPSKLTKIKEIKNNLNFDSQFMNNIVNQINTDKLIATDSKKLLLANNEVDKNHILEFEKTLINKMYSANEQYLYYEKQSFIVPLVTGNLYNASINKLNKAMIRDLPVHLNPYLKTVTDKVLEDQFVEKYVSPELTDLELKKARVESEIFEFEKNLIQKNKLPGALNNRRPKRRKIVKLLTLDEDHLKLKELYDQSAYLETEKNKFITNVLTMKIRTSKTVKIPMGGRNSNSVNARNFKSEMSHYNIGGVRGVGSRGFENFESDVLSFRRLIENLKGLRSEECITDYYDDRIGPGPDFLKLVKATSIEKANEFKNEYKRTGFAKAAEFASRLCHTLFKLSTTTNNRDYCTIDNLGYGNALLFVKGGSKMYKGSRSRLFRVAHPIDINLADFMGYRGSCQIFHHNGQDYVLTPWAQMHMDIMADGHKQHHRLFFDQLVNLGRTSRSFSELRDFDFLPFLLAFHQRRQTEVALHNSRYLIVNPLGNFSNLNGIISSFAGFNYSRFDSFLKISIMKNFKQTALSMLSIKKSKHNKVDRVLHEYDLHHVITGERLECSYDLVSMIYMTYTMTKAPVSKQTEQANNLWPILDDVHYYSKNFPFVDKMNDSSQQFRMEWNAEVYTNDFNYCPEFCQYVGFRFSKYLERKVGRVVLSEMWEQSISKNFQDLAASAGLRGYNPQNFFNKKGYQITYDFLKDNFLNKELISEVNVLDAKEKIRLLKNDIKTIGDCCIQWPLLEAVFHVVDKLQRAGGREIFVMDIYTKMYQQPVEDFFKKISKFTHNEFISVPSNKRTALIHKMYYEGDTAELNGYNLVLDCRRWAPHSNFQKYVHFINGMSDVLPESFLCHFGVLSNAMFDKVFITREYVYNAIKNNERYSPYLHHVKKSNKSLDAYSIKVPFSFVMGMFNYLSSIMHAANQMVAQEIIREYCFKKYGKAAFIVSAAHSDDSIAKLYLEDESILKECIAIYDYLLKCCNHMISVKKSCVSKVYMEFLSILYFFGEMLPVLRKFTGNIPFKANDMGYSSDVTFAASQSMEIIQNGGTHHEAYMLMKISESYISRYYGLPKLNPLIPFQFMGLMDSHPIELILGGTESEIYKHYRYNRNNLNRVIYILDKFGLIEAGKLSATSIKWNMGSRMNQTYKKSVLSSVKVDDTIMNSWTVKNGKFKSLFASYLWYCQKIKDPKFYSSLINDNTARRMARVYGAFNSKTITDSCIKVNVIYSAIQSAIEPENPIELPEINYLTQIIDLMRPLLHNLDDFWDCCENSELKVTDQDLTLKPICLNFGPPTIATNVKINPSKYVTYKLENDLFYLYGDESDPSDKCKLIDEYFANVGIDTNSLQPEDLYFLASKFIVENNNEFRLVGYVSSENRNVDSLNTMMEFLGQNSFFKEKIIVNARKNNMLSLRNKSRTMNVPPIVLDYGKVYWTCKFFSNNNMQEYLHEHYSENLAVLKKQLPDSWRHMATTEVEGKPIDDLNYYTIWTESQRKLGNTWIGKGELIVCCLEVKMRIRLDGSRIDKLYVKAVNNNFCPTTNWFLTNVSSMYANITMNMTDSIYQTRGKDYLCYHSGKKEYSINNPDSDFSIEIELVESISKIIESGHLVYFHNKSYFVNRIFPKKVNFALTDDLQSLIEIKKACNIKKMKEDYYTTKKSKEILKFVNKSQLLFADTYNIQFHDFFKKILGSTIYKILSLGYDTTITKNTFLSKVLDYKEIDPDFGFYSRAEAAEIMADPESASIPPEIERLITKIGAKNMTPHHFNLIAEDIHNIKNDPEPSINHILQITRLYGADSALDTAFTILNKNLRLNSIIAFSFDPRDYRVEWLKDMSAIVIDFMKDYGVSRKIEDFANYYKTTPDKLFTSLLCSYASFNKKDYKSARSYRMLVLILRELLKNDFQNYLIGSSSLKCYNTVDFYSMDQDACLNLFKSVLANFSTNDKEFIRAINPIFYRQLKDNLKKKHKVMYSFKNKKRRKSRATKQTANVVRKYCLCDQNGRLMLFDDEDEEEDAYEELKLEGMVECENFEENLKTNLVLIEKNLTSIYDYMIYGGHSRNVIFRTKVVPNFLRTMGAYGKRYEVFKSESLSGIDDNYVFIGDENVSIEIQGYAQMSDSEKASQTSFNDEFVFYVYDKVDLSELLMVENYKLRDELSKKRSDLLRYFDEKSFDENKALIETIMDELPRLDFELTKKLRNVFENKEELLEVNKSEDKKDLSEVLSEVFDNDFGLIVDFKKEVDIRIEEKDHHPYFKMLKNARFLESEVGFNDERLRSELNCISPGLEEALLKGSLRMNENQRRTMRDVLRMVKERYKDTIHHRQQTALIHIYKVIMANAETTKHISETNIRICDDMLGVLYSLLPEEEEETLHYSLPPVEYEPFFDYFE